MSVSRMKITEPLRRSNAIRVKRDLNILPESIKRLVLKLKQQPSNKPKIHIEEEEGQEKGIPVDDLFEEIRRGIKLRSIEDCVEERLVVLNSDDDDDDQSFIDSTNKNDATLSRVLSKVLRQRYKVMHVSDDESELSSIDSQLDTSLIYVSQYLAEPPAIKQPRESNITNRLISNSTGYLLRKQTPKLVVSEMVVRL